MKNRILLTLGFLASTVLMMAQNTLPGMRYQAVARDAGGELMSNEDLIVKIDMMTLDHNEELFYSEMHNATSNTFGLINLTIGEGKIIHGAFDDIPWSGQNIWSRISIKKAGEDAFRIVTSSKLYSVPYAFYAMEAGNIGASEDHLKSGSPSGGNTWSLKGNKKADTHNDPPVIGTTDYVPIVFITNDLERMRITEDGEIQMNGGLNVGGSAIIQQDLEVYDNVHLNSNGGTTTIDGPTTIGGTDMNSATFTGPVFMEKTLNVDGTSDFNNKLYVNNGSSTTLSGTLLVNQDADLDANLNVDGTTDLNSNLRVNNAASSVLSGTLNVNQNTDLDANLHVDGNSNLVGTLTVTDATTLNNTLTVANAAALNNTLTVANATALNNTLTVANATTLNNTLTVANATTLNNTLTVANTTTLNGVTNVNNALNVVRNAPDGQFVATFTNTEAGNGDGIKIKLGKNKTTLAPPALPPLLTAAQQQQIQNLLDCNIPVANKPQIVIDIVAEGIVADIQMIGGLTVGIGNLLIDFINTELGLPINFPGVTLPALGTPAIDLTLVEIPPLSVTGPLTLLGSFPIVPAVPTLDLSDLGIPAINLDMAFLGVPNLCLSDGGSPLNNNNKFIQFTDNADVQMGSIRAVSVTNWAQNYLNPVFLFKLRGALTSTVDKKHAQYHFKSEISAALKDYATIGVEYSSGNGDYAEWLKRSNPRESITPGDIVAIVGGKISKNLDNAEQLMVVSHNPIVLGNIPPEGESILGNNIAFMGQVPVKVMGPVESGDYIVTHGEIPGYGYGKSQDEMTIEDFKFAVGRSWDKDLTEGPKLVNTVVGVHNGDYFKVLKNYEAKFEILESRLEASDNNYSKLDARLNELSDMMMPATVKN